MNIEEIKQRLEEVALEHMELNAKLREIQENCEHTIVPFAIPHMAGRKCTTCDLTCVTHRSLCHTPANCQHEPLVVNHDN